MGFEKKDPANFSPNVTIPTSAESFRFWCQKVLPLVYDDSLSYYELLCKVVNYLNNTMADVNTLGTDVDNINKAYNQLQNYVNAYFSTLDVQTEINNKLDTMAQDGSLSALIQPLFDAYKTGVDNEINQQNNKISVLENRMNIFTSLPSGSTSGNAELIDIRVPANGFNNNQPYSNAGDAVRGQTNSLKGDIFNIAYGTSENVFHISGKGWINNTNGEFSTIYAYNYKKYYTSNIRTFIIYKADIQGAIVSIVNFFDKNGTYLKHELDGSDDLKTYNNVIIPVPKNAYYCYIVYNSVCDIDVDFYATARNNYILNALLNNFIFENGVENGAGWINKTNGKLETQPSYLYSYRKVKYDSSSSYLIKNANLSGNAVALINYYDENNNFLCYEYDAEIM